MLWKALEATGVFGRYGRIFGSFDVNMVCPLLGSWINYVVCMLTGCADAQVSFECIVQGFLKLAYGNVVFSHSKLHACHKSLVFSRSLLLTSVANLMCCVFFPVRAQAQGSLCPV